MLPFERFIAFAFSDLLKLAERNDNLFKQLFFNRETNIREFNQYIEPESGAGRNILITGDAGVGKTNFIHRCLKEAGGIEKYHPILIDYRAIGMRDVMSLLSSFLMNFTEYLEANKMKDHAITCAPIMTHEQLKQSFMTLHKVINSDRFADAVKRTPPMIICDDFDYIENELMIVVPLLESIIDSNRIKFVLTARPYLLDIIRFMDDKLRRDILNNSDKIKLKALDCQDVLLARLFAIMERQSTRYSLWRIRMSVDERVLLKWFGDNGINLDEISTIKFPFSDSILHFINQISDGNIRDMFDITKKIFISCRDRIYAATDECQLNLSREEILSLFYETREENFYIENLNTAMARRGGTRNSLLINVLQAVKEEEHISQRVRQNLGKMGHNEKEIDQALNHLSHRSSRYIVHRTLGIALDRERKYPLEKNWIITRRGEYYLQMALWPEYISRCGDAGAAYKDYVIGQK